MQPSSHYYHRKGMFYVVCATLAFTIVNAIIKETATRYPINEIAFFRFAFSLFPALIFSYLAEGKKAFSFKEKKLLPLQVLRTTISLVGLSFMFYAFGHMPLADAIAVSFSSTFFVILFAIPLLREFPNFRQVSALLVGFLGILLVANPSGQVVNLFALFCLIGAVSDGFIIALGRLLSFKGVPFTAVNLNYTLVATVLTSFSLFFAWVSPTPQDWGLLILTGIIGGVGQYWMTKGFFFAPTNLAVPMIYTAIIWSAALGYFFWDEIPTTHALIGIALIICAGVYLAFSEARRAKATALQEVLDPSSLERNISKAQEAHKSA